MGKEGPFGEAGCTGSRFNHGIRFLFTRATDHAYSSLDEPQFSLYTRRRLTVQGVDDDLLLFAPGHDHTKP